MKKWTYELIVVVVVLLIGGAGWWFNSTKDERQADAQYEQLVKFANRQAVEIAVIEQAAKLELLKRTLAEGKKPQIAPPLPVIADPDDVSKIP